MKIQHGPTELNFYRKHSINNQESTTLVEMFRSRGTSIKEDSVCIQLNLSNDELKEMVKHLNVLIE